MVSILGLTITDYRKRVDKLFSLSGKIAIMATLLGRDSLEMTPLVGYMYFSLTLLSQEAWRVDQLVEELARVLRTDVSEC